MSYRQQIVGGYRLQRVQDAATGLLAVYNASTRVHARPLLQQLQWLPVASFNYTNYVC